MRTIRRSLVCLVLLAACGGKRARETCERAADKYETCIAELLGPEMKQMAHDKRDIGACADDDRTVTMYDTCLGQTACDKFMACIDDYVEKHGP